MILEKLLNYDIKDWLELGTLTILDVCISDKSKFVMTYTCCGKIA